MIYGGFISPFCEDRMPETLLIDNFPVYALLLSHFNMNEVKSGKIGDNLEAAEDAMRFIIPTVIGSITFK